jgi:acyl-[acyl-carrier-protein]-phospholipid O-acyltransferase/long-chain-fatty-acid--[acyl-carrier-protein] ligase
MASPFALLTKVRFAPLFATNLLGTLNDNLFKTGLLMMASYGIFRGAPDKAAQLAVLATGLFVLPFFLVSAVAGQLADRFERASLVRLVKAAEVAIMAVGLAGFMLHSIPLLLAALFLMGVHSAVYGPLKYAILPLHLPEDELLGGVGLMEAGGYLAILGGQLLAGLVQPWTAGVIAVTMAVAGLAASLAIRPARSTAAPEALDLNLVRASVRLLGLARAERPVWLSMLGVAWFYVVGTVLLAELIPLVQGVLHAERGVAVLFLTLFSVGVAAGAVLANVLLKGEVSARYAPPAALLLAGLLLELSFAVRAFSAHADASGASLGLTRFLAEPAAWRVAADLFALALVGGLYVIPLSAMIQRHSPYAIRSRIQSANSIMVAAAGVSALLVTSLLLKLGVGLPAVIAVLAAGTLVVAAIACFLLPETVIKAVLREVLRFAYRVEITGEENMPPAGTGAVIVVNHVSYLDAALLAAFLPGKPTFAVHTRIAQAWWMRPILPLFDAFPVDTTNPLSTKAMVRAVQDGRALVIFPEGRITVTGALMKVFGGPGMVADRAHAPIVPVRIDGAQYTPLSHMKGKLRLRLFPKIRIAVLPQVRLETTGGARQRRAAAAERLYGVMSEMIFRTTDTDRTLYGALLDARAVHGRKAPAVEDVKRKPLSYGKLALGARLLGGRIGAVTEAGEAVGVMLPNVNAAVAAFFALQRSGRVAAMLNYSAGPAHLQSACDTAKIKTVITSRAFVDQAKLQGAVERLEQTGRRILWLEDLAKQISVPAKLAALLVPEGRPRGRAGDAAVILFTSGSEGAPKAVVLSHRNILSNCAQTAARIDFNPTDKVLNALPVFHSFGLTGGLLLPLLNGVKVLLYPNPLHYAAIPALAYDASATILFGSDTFLSGYARQAQGYDFYSLRYVFAGAEPVKAETRARFSEKFGLRILEGYGVTECAPVIAVNTPMHFRAGSVGRLLPAVEARLEPVPGVERGGRLHVRGPNIMTGYYLADDPGVLVPPKDGWHDTGDIVDIDETGFVTILGRAKRFAKIGGEMVSLAAVEASAAAAWPEFAHAAVARPDPKKGEQLVLFTTAPEASARELSAWGRAHGVPELMLPKDVRILEALPALATGKTDYVTLNALARAEGGAQGEREEAVA